MEPNKKLQHTKVFIRNTEEIKKVIDKALKLGFKVYGDYEKAIKSYLLVFYAGGDITYTEDFKKWLTNPQKEITVEEILSIKEDEGLPFKVFDKVLVRDSYADIWKPRFFGMYKKYEIFPYCMISDSNYKYCIHFEGNEDLAYTKNLNKNA